MHVGGKVAGAKYSGGHVSHTGQFFTPDKLNAKVYESNAYAKDTAAVVTHDEDMVFTGQSGSSGELKMSKLGDGYLGEVIVGVDPNATPDGVGVG